MNSLDNGVDLTPAELKAIEGLKLRLSTEYGHEVPIEEVIKLFLQDFQDGYRREKAKQDGQAQIEEIKKHIWCESQKAGHDVSDDAIPDWVKKYAAIWRAERESLQANGFYMLAKVTVTDIKGLHLRPSSVIAGIAVRHFCDVFVHRLNRPLEYHSFTLLGKDYVNVRSVLTILQLGIIKGDQLEFISMGDRSKEALEAIVKAIENGCTG